MPDDEKIEGPESEATEEQEGQEFSDAFREAASLDEKKVEAKVEEKVEESPKKRGRPPKEKAEEKVEEKSEGEEKEEKSGEEKEEDEITKRGKEIIDKEVETVKQKEEEETRIEAEKKVQESKVEAEKVPAITDKDVAYFHQMIPRSRIPDKVTMKVDGNDIELDLKTYLEENPEVALISALQGQELLVDLVNRGHLPTTAIVKSLIEERDKFWRDEMYGLAIIVELNNMGHTGVDMPKIIGSNEFDEWGMKQDNKIKALFRSNRPRDYALGVMKFISDSGVKTKEKPKKEEKKKEDDIFEDTMNSSRKSSGDFTSEDVNAEFSAAFRQASIEEDKNAGRK